MNYKILMSDDAKALEQEVSEYMRQGWHCAGGVQVVVASVDDEYKGGKRLVYEFFQAMQWLGES